MKLRRRKYKTKEKKEGYWPSFVDVMATAALVFFLLMTISIGMTSIFMDNIGKDRAAIYEQIDALIKENNISEDVMTFNRDEGKMEIYTETFFAKNSYDLSEDGAKVANMLNNIFFQILKNENIRDEIKYVEVVGHTDFLGSTTYGRTLSVGRAASFLNSMVPENSELENLCGEKFKASGMSEFETNNTKELRDRGLEVYNELDPENINARKIEVRLVFSESALEDLIKSIIKGNG